MKLAIHHSNTGFHPRWIAYCETHDISYKKVDCYANDLIYQLQDCNGLMWHHNQGNPKDILIAKQILFALEHTGFKTFPNFPTSWHFDDKVAQKYLLERIAAPMVPSYVFFKKSTALEWAEKTVLPKVFKLRGGAGSANVQLVRSKSQARKLIHKAFGKGFSNYDAWGSLSERWRKFRLGKTTAWDVIKGIIRLGYRPEFAKINGREKGYAYFQDFIPNNDSDIRIIIIGNKAFGLKRYVRSNDFRASGSGDFAYDRDLFDERCIQIAFDLNKKIGSQSIAYDFVFDVDGRPLIVEISYGFTPSGYDSCPGYWDEQLNWYSGQFNPYGWMVEIMLK